MQATLRFTTRTLAENFATQWTFYSKKGHVMGSGSENVEVTLHDVTEADKTWINNFVQNINS